MAKDKKKIIDEIKSQIPNLEDVDITTLLFNKDERDNMLKRMRSLLLDPLLTDGVISTREGCWLAIIDARERGISNTLTYRDCCYRNLIFVIEDSITYFEDKFDPNKIDLDDYIVIMQNDVYDSFCRKVRIGDYNRRVLDLFREKYIKGTATIEDIPGLLKSDENRRITYQISIDYLNNRIATIDKNDRDQEKSEFLKKLRAIKQIVQENIEKYNIWDGLTQDKEQQYTLLRKLDALSYKNSKDPSNRSDMQDEVNEHFILYAFLLYARTYTNNFGKMLFGSLLKGHCRTPKKTFNFVTRLKESGYASDFYLEYNNYIESSGDHPIFDINIIKPTLPRLDQNPNHKDWYEQIKNDKYVGNEFNLLKAVGGLYDELKEGGYIRGDTSRNLFIYRLTGFLSPEPPEKKIYWEENKSILAAMIKYLYGKEHCSPPYKKVTSYFEPLITNASQLVKCMNNNTDARVRELLEKCSFVINDYNF